MNKTFLLLNLLILCFKFVLAQEKTENKLVYITNQTISEVCFDRGRFVRFVDKQTAVAEKFMLLKAIPQKLIIQTIIKTDTLPEFAISACPELNEKDYIYLLEELTKIKPLNSLVVDFIYCLELSYNKEKINAQSHFSPEIINPLIKSQNDFFEADLGNSILLLQKWTKTEVLPVLTAFLKTQDRKYIGAVSLGMRTGKALKDNSFDIDSLTDFNPYYWRALIEMKAGNNLVFTLKTFLLIANGDFDNAFRLSSVLDLFKKNNSVSDYYLDELYRMVLIDNKLKNILSQIEILFSEGKTDSVSLMVNYVRNILPKSADVNNFLYQFYLQNNEKEDLSKYFNQIHLSDPFYSIDKEAETALENYLKGIRSELDSLFKNPDYLHKDFMRYADIALILGDYSFAAHLYWLAITHFSDAEAGRDNLNAYFLYCLKKLGMDNLLINFDVDQNMEFNRIETELQTLKENHPAYRDF